MTFSGGIEMENCRKIVKVLAKSNASVQPFPST